MSVRRIATVLATATSLVVAGVGAGGVATAAAATAKLTIPYTGCVGSTGIQYDYTLRVEGTTGYHPYGMRVDVRLWGEDEWYDDALGGPYVQSYDWSGYYSVSFCANRSTLDEDIGQDELYAGVRVYDRATGAQKESVESNRIRAYF
jgi:hypothetical protein